MPDPTKLANALKSKLKSRAKSYAKSKIQSKLSKVVNDKEGLAPKKFKNAGKRVLNEAKGLIKGEISKKALKQKAANYIKGKVRAAANKQKTQGQKDAEAAGKPDGPGADFTIGTKIDLKSRRKERSKKKIAKWDAERKKRNAKPKEMSEQDKFLAMDKANKKK